MNALDHRPRSSPYDRDLRQECQAGIEPLTWSELGGSLAVAGGLIGLLAAVTVLT